MAMKRQLLHSLANGILAKLLVILKNIPYSFNFFDVTQKMGDVSL